LVAESRAHQGAARREEFDVLWQATRAPQQLRVKAMAVPIYPFNPSDPWFRHIHFHVQDRLKLTELITDH
jgi:hypothetical protein